MNKIPLLLAGLAACVCSAHANNVLHYNRPATFFEEAFVIGNGNIGAIVYGIQDGEKLSLNDITLWTGEPENGVTTPDAYKAIPEIRAALDRGDYRAAAQGAGSLHRQLSAARHSENRLSQQPRAAPRRLPQGS